MTQRPTIRLLFVSLALLVAPTMAQAASNKVVIGDIDDMSGVYADIIGPAHRSNGVTRRDRDGRFVRRDVHRTGGAHPHGAGDLPPLVPHFDDPAWILSRHQRVDPHSRLIGSVAH